MNIITNPLLLAFIIIIIGFIASFIGSLIGSGVGLITVVLLVLVLGDTHNQEAKLIMFPAILVTCIFGAIKYIRVLKQSPHLKYSFLIIIGALPMSIIGIVIFSPYFNTPEFINYFPFLYAILVLFLIIIIDLKSKINIKKPLPDWTLPLFGIIIGFLGGTFGLGMLTMPLLVVGLKIPLKKAIVTFLIIVAIYSISSICVAIINGQYSSFSSEGISWYLPIIIIIGSFSGSFFGPLLNKKLSNKGMSIMFNLVMISLFIYEIINGIILFTS